MNGPRIKILLISIVCAPYLFLDFFDFLFFDFFFLNFGPAVVDLSDFKMVNRES